eukprot:gene8825-67_t
MALRSSCQGISSVHRNNVNSVRAPTRVVRGLPVPVKIQQSVGRASGFQQLPSTVPRALVGNEKPDGGLDLLPRDDVPFKKIMAANRGEIAIRIFRAGIELGLRTVAVYSPADRLQPHRYKADEAYCVGDDSMAPVACYLDMDAIIKAAKDAGVDAIHPGYGFLSERADFAQKCADAGITFIGPNPETIQALGDKTAARRAAIECGVSVVPGTDQTVATAEEAMQLSREFGYPVMLKAAMGGGGRGMRIVRKDDEVKDAFTRASNEAVAAFGDGRMFVEKYVEEPRHIEIQILADNYGNVVHLYERDCSVQRRHQKVVEMAPSIGLAEETRQALFNDAVKLCKHVGYRNAGTVEFMVDKEGKHYFLEVNPRVQVEHTVTEEITGVDIVQSQILIAGGATLQSLGFGCQEEVPPIKGFSIQCRVTSEDPEQNFQPGSRHLEAYRTPGGKGVRIDGTVTSGNPDSGRLEAYRTPGGMGVRLDGAVTTGNVMSRHYDSLLAKVITSSTTFPKAVQKMQRALNEFQIRGIKTNIPFLENVLRHPEFLSGDAKTSFIEKNAAALFNFEGHGALRASQLLSYLAEQSRQKLFFSLFNFEGQCALGVFQLLSYLAEQSIHNQFFSLFNFEGHGALRASQLLSYLAEQGHGALGVSQLLSYLAEQVVNGGDHPGASSGLKCAKVVPPSPSIPSHLINEPLTGWRDILVAEGPEAWAKAVRAHKGVLVTDTTMRDAHQSLLATRMRTIDMMKILKNAGSLEMWGGATFDVALRFLHECPWKRLEKLRKEIPNIPFQMLFRGANAVGYTSYSDNVVDAFVRESKLCGVDIFRIFDSLNYIDNLKFGIDCVVRAGGVAEGTICYTGDLTDPKKAKYNLDYYIKLADQLVEHGVHSLAIKDMAGLLKPKAATILVGALRARFPYTPIHVHTHDSAGTAVATQLAAAAAGADIIDCCMDSMSGLTSQPSMGAIVNSLAGTELDTGLVSKDILHLSTYWENARGLYAPFESNLRAVSSDVYDHEMPGGQYTNLKFQATTLGLGNEWGRICTSYAAANRALGDLVKVTPSSKVVGDLAQFMVQNNLDEFELVNKAEQLSFPSSVVEFMQGYLGEPAFGFPEPLRSRVLKDKRPISGRPGASMPPLDLAGMEYRLKDKYGNNAISYRDVLSSAMYPKVFSDYMDYTLKYSTLIEKLPTNAFFAPMEEDDEIDFELAKGVAVSIKYKAVGELQLSGKREVFFEANGIPRVVEVLDKVAEKTIGKKAARERADLAVLGSVGAPMAGAIIEVQVKAGQTVKAGQALVIMSAMKMETAICAPIAGVVTQVAVQKDDALDAGDLVVSIMAEAETDELKSLDEDEDTPKAA